MWHREVVVAANELVMSMIKAVMMLAPVGLASLIAGELLEVGLLVFISLLDPVQDNKELCHSPKRQTHSLKLK